MVEVKQHILNASIDRFEGKSAVISFGKDKKQKLLWPIKNLPDDAQEGMTVRLAISTSQSDQEETQKLARAVLNEILSDG